MMLRLPESNQAGTTVWTAKDTKGRQAGTERGKLTRITPIAADYNPIRVDPRWSRHCFPSHRAGKAAEGCRSPRRSRAVVHFKPVTCVILIHALKRKGERMCITPIAANSNSMRFDSGHGAAPFPLRVVALRCKAWASGPIGSQADGECGRSEASR